LEWVTGIQILTTTKGHPYYRHFKIEEMPKSNLLFTLLFTMICFFSLGQSSPGGVQQPAYWYVTDSTIASLRDLTTGQTVKPVIPLSTTMLNHRRALQFSGNNNLSIQLNRTTLHQASLFTVYQCTSTAQENIIWHIKSKEQTGLVLTTSRMADLADNRYMNYTDRMPLQPKVNAYVQQKNSDSIVQTEHNWHLGQKPDSPQLPITTFTGLLPEIIAYNRVLNSQELLQVSSYLAIKYGITLSEPDATYLNSQGQKIWDGSNYSSYHHNIAGIGRDDSSGLIQKIAGSSNQSGLLTIYTKDTLANGTYCIWGDNDLPFIPAAKVPGVPPAMLQKQGLLVLTGPMDSVRTTLQWDTKQVDAPLPFQPVYWLALDRTGSGDFSLPGTEYIKMSQLDKQGIASFDGIVWRKNSNGKTAFGWLAGKDILVSANITAPTCANATGGSMYLKAWGATFPCTITIQKNNQPFSSANIISNMDGIIVNNISAGQYVLKLIDASQKIYTDSFYINNQDAPQPVSILREYVLFETQRLDLDASVNMPPGLTYQWKGPGGFQSNLPRTTIIQHGSYTLIVSKNGCTYTQKIEVRRPPKNAFTNIQVSPNPAQGVFMVNLSLDKVAKVTMDVYTEDGKLLAVRQMEGLANYNFSHEIAHSGLYHLVFRSDLSVQTKKIVILK
jgi:hypothetical protein